MRLIAALLCLTALVAQAAGANAASHPLQTSLQEPFLYRDDATAKIVAARIHDAGATWVRIDVEWGQVAPRGAVKPLGFDPSNPADSAYTWATVDAAVRHVVAAGLQPFINISEAPAWAERPAGGRLGTNNPDPIELRQF